jgi:hypothetical protein
VLPWPQERQDRHYSDAGHRCKQRYKDEFIGRVCAKCEEGGEASDGGCVGGAGVTHGDGGDINFRAMSVAVESVG